MSGRKIASAAVQTRTQTPFFSWLRDKLLAVKRRPGTGTPGLPTEDGIAVYQNPNRFPNTQSARSGYNPDIPGGVHHKLAENYYYDRDGRRSVLPPVALYEGKADGTSEFKTSQGEKIEYNGNTQTVNKGPDANFGLAAPTPGFGCEWPRNRDEEEESQKRDPQLAILERYDKFLTSNRS